MDNRRSNAEFAEHLSGVELMTEAQVLAALVLLVPTSALAFTVYRYKRLRDAGLSTEDAFEAIKRLIKQDKDDLQ